MNGLINDTTRDIIALVSLFLTIVQAIIAIRQWRVSRAPKSAILSWNVGETIQYYRLIVSNDVIRIMIIIMVSGFISSLMFAVLYDSVSTAQILRVLELIMFVITLIEGMGFFGFLVFGADISERKYSTQKPKVPWSVFALSLIVIYTTISVIIFFTIETRWVKNFVFFQALAPILPFVFSIPRIREVIKEIK